MNQNSFRVLFVVAILGIIALLAPVIWAIASAGMGILVLGLIGAVGIGAIQMLPLLGQKLENWVLSKRKQEARTNPIEQLQNDLQLKAKVVADFRQAVISIGSQIKSLQDMVNDRKKQRQNYDSSAQDKSIAAMIAAHATMNQKYERSEKALEEYKLAIQDKEFEWKFSQAGKKALSSLSASSGKELLDKMLADEAFAAVSDNFNNVFAELEMEAQHLTDSKQLSFGNGLSLDLECVNISSIKV